MDKNFNSNPFEYNFSTTKSFEGLYEQGSAKHIVSSQSVFNNKKLTKDQLQWESFVGGNGFSESHDLYLVDKFNGGVKSSENPIPTPTPNNNLSEITINNTVYKKELGEQPPFDANKAPNGWESKYIMFNGVKYWHWVNVSKDPSEMTYPQEFPLKFESEGIVYLYPIPDKPKDDVAKAPNGWALFKKEYGPLTYGTWLPKSDDGSIEQ